MQFGFDDQINRALGVFEHRNNVREHYHCIREIFNLYKTPEEMKKLSERPDLDTICAYDYARMKNYAMNGEGLHMNDWHPELRGVTEIPKLN